MKIKKGDIVKIITGRDKGKSAKVIKSFPETGKVILEGLNLYKKHTKPKKQGEKGELVQVPRPLLISNVMLVCSNCKKTTRIGQRVDGDKKVRACKKCGATI